MVPQATGPAEAVRPQRTDPSSVPSERAPPCGCFGLRLADPKTVGNRFLLPNPRPPPSVVLCQSSPALEQSDAPVVHHEPRLTLPRKEASAAGQSLCECPSTRNSGLTLAASVLQPPPRDEGTVWAGQWLTVWAQESGTKSWHRPTPVAMFPWTTVLTFLSPFVQWAS